jgi:hypothetical protein
MQIEKDEARGAGALFSIALIRSRHNRSYATHYLDYLQRVLIIIITSYCELWITSLTINCAIVEIAAKVWGFLSNPIFIFADLAG